MNGNGHTFTVFTEPVALLRRSPGLFLPNEGVFSRLFPELPPHEPGPRDASAHLREFAKGLYDDGGDNLPTNSNLPAAYSFFAQFVAHDMSFDPSRFGQRSVDGVQHANLRTPRLDLDHLYGGDPDLNPHYFRHDKQGNTYEFLIERKTLEFEGRSIVWEDLPRHEGRAQIPDQRDDQHVILSQMHLAFMKLHNVLMAASADEAGLRRRARFFKAQTAVRWYYQYAIVEDLLPRMLGTDGMATLQRYRERWTEWQRDMIEPPVSPQVPVEFSVGVYRVGHSTLRPSYQVNGRVKSLPLFPIAPPAAGGPASLVGFGRRHPSLVVSWDRLLEVRGREGNVQRARVFGDVLSKVLSKVPGTEIPHAEAPEPDGLAELDLERGLRLGLPSGQAVARRLGIPEIAVQIGNDPLWYYAMREVRDGGNSVGPVSAAIMSKVFLDLLHLDPGSYLYQAPNWAPTGSPGWGNKLPNLMHEAGMPFSDEEAFRTPA